MINRNIINWKHLLIILTIFSLLVISSCKSKKDSVSQDDNASINLTIKSQKDLIVTFKEVYENVTASEIFDSISYINLETTPSCVIGDIRKIILTNDRIYIFDALSNSILCFDNNGLFKSKFDNKGKGPEEYSSISDFDINQKTKEIVLLVNYKDLIFLDNDLKFKTRKSTETMAGGILCLNSTQIALYTSTFSTAIEPTSKDYFQLIILDIPSGKKTGYFPNSFAKRVGLGSNYAFSRSDKLVLTYPLTNRFYVFSDSNLIEGMIDFTRNKYNIDIPENEFLLSNYLNMDNKAKYFHKFYFLNNWIFFTGIYNRRDLFCLINLATKNQYCSTKLINDINGLPLIRVNGNFSNGLLIVLQPNSYLKMTNLNLPKGFPSKDLLDNPLILKCFLKQ